MQKKDELLNLLYFYPSEYLSSKNLAEKLDVSQKDIYRYIRQLRSEGYKIKGQTNNGYSIDREDALSFEGIRQYYPIEKEKVRIFSSLPSTNTTAKEMAACGAPEGTLCIAEKQTHGRGRMGRDFFSPSNSGIYMSIILRPNFTPKDSVLITTMAAVAVCDAIEKITDCSPKIKWVNDIYIRDRKVCGILTESVFNTENEKIDFSILGIGLNLTKPQKGFPRPIKTIAGSVLMNKEKGSRCKMIGLILKHFYKYYLNFENKSFVKAYQSKDFLAGKDVEVRRGMEVYSARVLGVNDDLSLRIINDDGITENLSSGEISIKIQKKKHNDIK